MAQDTTLAVRIAVVEYLKAGPAIQAIVGNRVNVQPLADQQWPFVRYGTAFVEPMVGTCLDGMLAHLTIHSFAAGETDDDCALLAAAVSRRLDLAVIPLATTFPATIKDMRWTGTQILRDTARADGWHGLSTFDARVVS